jgi:hypothetical protein
MEQRGNYMVYNIKFNKGRKYVASFSKKNQLQANQPCLLDLYNENINSNYSGKKKNCERKKERIT